MRQRHWIDLFNDYNCEIRYHPDKANVVASALSRKERIKPKRIRSMNMTLQGLDEMIERRRDGALYYLDRIWVLLKGDVRILIMDEAHKSKYSIHPGADKMYYDLKDRYWWSRMKKDIVVYERIAMDFVTTLPRTNSGHDTIWVIVDRLTKSAHFLPMREVYKMDRLARLYLNKIVARHDDSRSTLSRPRPDAVTESLMPSLDRSRWRHFMIATPSPRSNEEREKSFEELNQRLVSAPVLTLPSGSGKANVVVDALSRKSGMIAEAQKEDSEIWTIVENLDKQVEFHLDDDNVLWQGIRLVVPNDATLREALLTEAHSSLFSVHPGSTKMLRLSTSGLVRRHDTFWVVVDRLTKSAHFLPICKDYSVSRLTEIFQQEIVRLHGTPSAIVSDRDPCFASRFWKAWTGNWDDYICLIEFVYNKSWHASIKCAPFEMLYGRKFRAPICWDQVGERVIEGPEMIEVTNAKVAVAKEKLKEARTRQKSYADKHRRSLEFQPGDHVFLKVSPARGVRRFDKVMRKKTIPFVKILWRNHLEREATWETEESIQTSYPHFLP
nr:reverse transcriptase domain-containing protein [Tanacetum cinerariifolium]